MSEVRFGCAAARLAGAAAMLIGWRPKEFWEATPAELAASLQVGEAIAVPEASEIAELMRRFPDE
jgi:uncharacterized phage protein (TIGR02216 family)